MARDAKRLEGENTVAAYLTKPYARLLTPEPDGTYRAEIFEFPGCVAEGDTAAEALSTLEAVAETWLEAALEAKLPIPAPMDECDFSGKLVLRLPKSLHRKAAMAARRDSVSLNQFIVTSLAEQIGGRQNPGRNTAQILLLTTGISTADSRFTALPSFPGVRQQVSFPAPFQGHQYASR